MAIVPTNKAARIAFYEDHIDVWTSNAADIGLTAGECTALAALITAARSAYSAQGVAADAARAATGFSNNAIASMQTLGAAAIAKIKAYAESTNNPNVFNIAQIPAPAAGSPVPPPGKPNDFVVTLNQTGSLTLRWKCTNPPGATGTAYEVRRRLTPTGTFQYVGIAGGDKTFTDETLPAGSTGVAYRVTGVRSGLMGPTVQCDVNFGVGGGGGASLASVTDVLEVSAPKLAAA